MKAFISPAVAPEACECRFFPLLYFSLTEGSQVLWVTKPLHSESHHSSFFLLDCLLSGPLFTAWTSTQDEFMRVLFRDRPDECSVTQPARGSCGVNICHVAPFWGSKHFFVRLFPALQAILPYNPSQGSRTKGLCGGEQIIATRCLSTLSFFSV